MPDSLIRPVSHEEGEAPEEAITAPARVEALLQRIIAERLFVTVRLPGFDTSYNSTILELDRARGELLLDELYPEDGHVRLQQLRELRVHARLDGAALTFNSTLRDVGQEGGLNYYRIRIPERVDYYQRRRFHRVDADQVADVEVKLMGEGAGEVPVTGRLHDISEGGISFWLDATAARALRTPWKVPHCEIRIPETEPLACAIEVRNVRDEEGQDEHIVGARFLFADPRMRQRVARLVAAIERQLLRQRQDD